MLWKLLWLIELVMVYYYGLLFGLQKFHSCRQFVGLQASALSPCCVFVLLCMHIKYARVWVRICKWGGVCALCIEFINIPAFLFIRWWGFLSATQITWEKLHVHASVLLRSLLYYYHICSSTDASLCEPKVDMKTASHMHDAVWEYDEYVYACL